MIASLAKIREAIHFIPSTERETWVRIGMAIKSELGEEGFDIWDAWSQDAKSYNAKAARVVWKSISEYGRIGIGTLFHEAKAGGWSDNGQHQEPSPQEIARRMKARAEREERGEEEERKKQANYQRAAKTAAALIKTCKPEEHNYLRSKQLPDVLGLVDEDRALVVPMRNLADNELVGCQIIKWLMEPREWEKKMIFGMRAKGAVFRLGSPHAGETWLVEGYATGLTLELVLRRLNLNASVLICFSADNMAHVAPMVGGRKFVFADNDVSGTGQRVANETGLPFCMSPALGEDCNDMYARAGLLAVCKLVMETRRM